MRLKNLFLMLIVLIAGLQGCSKDDPSPDQTLVTLSVSSDYPLGPNLWAFITDSKGDVFCSREVKRGTIAPMISSTVPDVINLTLVSSSLDPVQLGHRFYTYPAVGQGSTVLFVSSNGKNAFIIPSTVGNVQVSIANYVPLFFSYNAMFASDGYSAQLLNLPTASPALTTPIHTNPADILVSTHRTGQGGPVYAWVTGAKPGDNKVIDYSNFLAFPNKILLPFDQFIKAEIHGYKQTPNGLTRHLLSSVSYQGTPSEPAAVGYLDGFDSYETVVNWTLPVPQNKLRTVTYTRRGTINASITMAPYVTYTQNVTNSTMRFFSFAYGGNPVFQKHTWGYNNASLTFVVSWEIYSDGTVIAPFVKFPDDLKAKYPDLDFDALKVKSSEFYHFTDGYSYEDYFDDIQTGDDPFANPEYYRVRFDAQ